MHCASPPSQSHDGGRRRPLLWGPGADLGPAVRQASGTMFFLDRLPPGPFGGKICDPIEAFASDPGVHQTLGIKPRHSHGRRPACQGGDVPNAIMSLCKPPRPTASHASTLYSHAMIIHVSTLYSHVAVNRKVHCTPGTTCFVARGLCRDRAVEAHDAGTFCVYRSDGSGVESACVRAFTCARVRALSSCVAGLFVFVDNDGFIALRLGRGGENWT